MKLDDYIEMISKRSDRFGSQLLKLMDKYDATCLIEITVEQAKKFYEHLVANNIDDSQ